MANIIIPLTVNAFCMPCDSKADCIGKGDFVRAKREDWSEYKNGFITDVTRDRISVLCYMAEGNAVNYFEVFAEDAVSGRWSIYRSRDLISVDYYPISEPPPVQEGDDDA